MNELKTIVQVDRNKLARKLQIINIFCAAIEAETGILKQETDKVAVVNDMWISQVIELLLASDNLCLYSRADIFEKAWQQYQQNPQVNLNNKELIDMITDFKGTLSDLDDFLKVIGDKYDTLYPNKQLASSQSNLFLDKEQITTLTNKFVDLIATSLPLGNADFSEEESRLKLVFIKSIILLTHDLHFEPQLIVTNLLKTEPGTRDFLTKFLEDLK